MNRLFVFDWNGCLLADTKICWKANNFVLKKFGRKQLSLKQFMDFMSIPIKEFYLKTGFSEKEIQEFGKEMSELFHKTYELNAANCRTRKGTKELLNWVQAQGDQAIILSNHSKKGIEFQLERLNLKDYFTEVLANSSEYEVVVQRTKAGKLQNYLNAHNFGKSNIVILGDSIEEIMVGKELGITSIAVIGGNYSKHRLVAEKPSFLANHLLDVKAILEKKF